MSTEHEFVAAAKQYIALVENAQKINVDDFNTDLLTLLQRVLSLGLQLECDEELTTESEGETKIVIPAVSDSVLSGVQHTFRSEGLYHKYFDPFERSSHCEQLIVDDLCDIYQELKSPMALYETGDPAKQANAILEWRFGFTGSRHTAQHICSVLMPLLSLNS